MKKMPGISHSERVKRIVKKASSIPHTEILKTCNSCLWFEAISRKHGLCVYRATSRNEPQWPIVRPCDRCRLHIRKALGQTVAGGKMNPAVHTNG